MSILLVPLDLVFYYPQNYTNILDILNCLGHNDAVTFQLSCRLVISVIVPAHKIYSLQLA